MRQTKRRNTLHEISTLPGDGASHPCITVGVLEEVGLSGFSGGGGGGFVQLNCAHLHTHACAFTHFSVGLQARKAVATSVSLRSDVSAVRAPVDVSALPSWTLSCGETTSLSDSLLTAPLLLQAAQTRLTAGRFGRVTMAEPVNMVSCKKNK